MGSSATHYVWVQGCAKPPCAGGGDLGAVEWPLPSREHVPLLFFLCQRLERIVENDGGYIEGCHHNR